MKIILQRVDKAELSVDGKVISNIKKGILLLVGIGHNDTKEAADFLANKSANLRIFEDESGKMNRSVIDEGGEILAVSQFTLYGDTRKGRRPDFIAAAKPEEAEPLFDYFVERLKEHSDLNVKTGIFGAHMIIDFVNNGPVTLIMEK